MHRIFICYYHAMSQEILSALSQDAISRMSPYELVERAVGLRAEMYNALGIEPIDAGDGNVLYAVTSGLAATSGMRHQTVVEGDELVRRTHVPLPLTAFADIVELRPPGRTSEGNARLFRVEEPVTAASAEIRRPFRAAAEEVVTTPDPDHKTMSPIRFNGVTNTFYRACPEVEHPNEVFLSSGYGKGHRVQADPRTGIHLQTVGRDELDHELGVLASVSGPVRVTLDERNFARITNTGVLYGPSEAKTVEVDIPLGTPQSHDSKFYRIPDDATVASDEAGDIVPQGERAANRKYEHVRLNPQVGTADILRLLPGGTIDWTDGTAAFLDTFSDRFARTLPLNVQALYEQTLLAARARIREALPGDREPAIGYAGCLAVAAKLAELPAFPQRTRVVDAAYFGITG